jgi:hypothetical protein
MHWINILLTVITAFIGAKLGDWLQKPQDNLTILYWVFILALHQGYIQWLIMQNNGLKTEVQTLKDKVSELLILKKTDGTKGYNISLHAHVLNDKFSCSSFKPLKVYITAPFSSDNQPALEIRSDSRFQIKVGNNVIHPQQHANKYVYFIAQTYLKQTYNSKKYFFYELQIQARDAGIHTVNFIAESENFKDEISQKFDCA